MDYSSSRPGLYFSLFFFFYFDRLHSRRAPFGTNVKLPNSSLRQVRISSFDYHREPRWRPRVVVGRATSTHLLLRRIDENVSIQAIKYKHLRAYVAKKNDRAAQASVRSLPQRARARRSCKLSARAGHYDDEWTISVTRQQNTAM